MSGRIELPYPPSVNRLWRRVGPRTLLSREGRLYRQRLAAMLTLKRLAPLTGRVGLRIVVHPPDRRRRDLDNILKSLLDSLQAACLFEDDAQVDDLHVIRGDVMPEGRVVVDYREL